MADTGVPVRIPTSDVLRNTGYSTRMRWTMVYLSGLPESVRAVADQWIEDHGLDQAYELALDHVNLTTKVARFNEMPSLGSKFWGDVRDYIYERRVG